jgi:hypothetical protein
MVDLLYALQPEIRLNLPTPFMGSPTGFLFLQTTVTVSTLGMKYIHLLLSNCIHMELYNSTILFSHTVGTVHLGCISLTAQCSCRCVDSNGWFYLHTYDLCSNIL